MAQTRKKRRSKHRGTAAGTVQTRGRTGKPGAGAGSKASAAKLTAAERRQLRMEREPSWLASAQRAALAAVALIALTQLGLFGLEKLPVSRSALLALFAFAVYVPFGYWTDGLVYRRRMASKAKLEEARRAERKAGRGRP